MSFDLLCQQIIDLSNRVEKLIETEDEADCAALLAKRQTLLEKLKALVDEGGDNNSINTTVEQQKLRTFLLSIQTRDKHYIQIVKDKAQKLLGQGAQQTKSKKAIKAYRSSI